MSAASSMNVGDCREKVRFADKLVQAASRLNEALLASDPVWDFEYLLQAVIDRPEERAALVRYWHWLAMPIFRRPRAEMRGAIQDLCALMWLDDLQPEEVAAIHQHVRQLLYTPYPGLFEVATYPASTTLDVLRGFRALTGRGHEGVERSADSRLYLQPERRGVWQSASRNWLALHQITRSGATCDLQLPLRHMLTLADPWDLLAFGETFAPKDVAQRLAVSVEQLPTIAALHSGWAPFPAAGMPENEQTDYTCLRAASDEQWETTSVSTLQHIPAGSVACLAIES